MLPPPGVTDGTVTIPANAFTRPGYTFTGWNTQHDGNGTSYQANAQYTLNATGNMLHAQWSADTQTLTLEPNGGTGQMLPVSKVTDGTVNLSENEFARPGYTFTGWNTQPDGNGTSYRANALYTLNATGNVLYAQWLGDPQTLTLEPNGGTGQMSAPSGVTDETITLPNNVFNRPGYTFTGWNTKPEGSGTAYLAEDPYVLTLNTHVLHAQWVADTQTLTLEPNGGIGEMLPPAGVTDGTATIPENEFAFPGYSFTGWNTQPDGTGTSYGTDATYTLNATENVLYAQWSADTQTLTLESNGGTGQMPTVDRVTDETIALPVNTFTRPGYTFTGWNTADDGSGTSYQANTLYTLNATGNVLYAQWAADTQTLTLEPNGGTGQMLPPAGVTDGTVILPANAFIRPGYTFTGWNTQPDGNGTGYRADDSYVLTMNTHVLHAQWTADTQTLTLESNGGNGQMPASAGVTDGTATVPANAFIRPGYTFTGWNTQPDGSGTSYQANVLYTLSATGNLLYAQWTADAQTLTLEPNGSTRQPVTVDGVTDETVTIPENGFTRPGYTFVGWNTTPDGTGTSYNADATYTLTATGNVLYAQWTADAPPTVTHDQGTTEPAHTRNPGTLPQTGSNNTHAALLTVLAFLGAGLAFLSRCRKNSSPGLAPPSTRFPKSGNTTSQQK